MRPDILIPQLRNPPAFDWSKVRKGIERIIFGLFLKVVLADTVADFVDTGFAANAASLSGINSWTLSFLFGFQIFFDFAGYSSIAIGSASLISIYVPENFNWPYVSTSPREFWKRWHISLSTWIRDYVYIPLMGTYRGHGHGAWDTMNEAQESTRSPAARTYALFLTWTIMGFWHGANWTFALWGIYHAAMIFAHRQLSPKLGQTILGHWFVAWCITLPLMMAGWIPFRAHSLRDTFTMWGEMLMPWRNLSISLSPNSYMLAAALTLLMMAAWVAREVISPKLRPDGIALNTARAVTFMVAAAAVFVMLQQKTQFIYFQF